MLNKNSKIHRNLNDFKQKSSLKRLILASKFAMILSVVNFLSESLNNGICNNYQKKLILVFVHLFHSLLPSILKRFEKHSATISFILGEIINIILIAYSFNFHPEAELL